MGKNALNDVHCEIIKMMAACSMNASEVVRKTYRSRGSVDYYVARIKEITGKDPRNFYDLIDLLKMVEEPGRVNNGP